MNIKNKIINAFVSAIVLVLVGWFFNMAVGADQHSEKCAHWGISKAPIMEPYQRFGYPPAAIDGANRDGSAQDPQHDTVLSNIDGVHFDETECSKPK